MRIEDGCPAGIIVDSGVSLSEATERERVRRQPGTRIPNVSGCGNGRVSPVNAAKASDHGS